MTQYRINAEGKEVRYDKETDRWVPKVPRESKSDSEETTEDDE